MSILSSGGPLRQLFPWRNETLSDGRQHHAVDDRSDSPTAGDSRANDTEHTRLGEIAREAYAARRRRAEIAGSADLFGEPAWDILLTLFVAGCEGRRLSPVAVCSGAAAPESTALRWITILEKRGMILRAGEPDQGFIRLSESASRDLADYFANS